MALLLTKSSVGIQKNKLCYLWPFLMKLTMTIFLLVTFPEFVGLIGLVAKDSNNGGFLNINITIPNGKSFIIM